MKKKIIKEDIDYSRDSDLECLEVLLALNNPETGQYKTATISTDDGLHTYGFKLIKPPVDYKKYLPTEEDIRTACALSMFVIQLFIVLHIYGFIK